MATIVVFGLVHQGKEEALQKEEEEEALQAPGSPLSVHAIIIDLPFGFPINNIISLFMQPISVFFCICFKLIVSTQFFCQLWSPLSDVAVNLCVFVSWWGNSDSDISGSDRFFPLTSSTHACNEWMCWYVLQNHLYD